MRLFEPVVFDCRSSYNFTTQARLPWGAAPGHTKQSVGSGIGFVHNTFMYDHVNKGVVYAPWRIWPKPVWFISHGKVVKVGSRMAALAAEPSVLGVPSIAFWSLLA